MLYFVRSFAALMIVFSGILMVPMEGVFAKQAIIAQADDDDDDDEFGGDDNDDDDDDDSLDELQDGNQPLPELPESDSQLLETPLEQHQVHEDEPLDAGPLQGVPDNPSGNGNGKKAEVKKQKPNNG